MPDIEHTEADRELAEEIASIHAMHGIERPKYALRESTSLIANYRADNEAALRAEIERLQKSLGYGSQPIVKCAMDWEDAKDKIERLSAAKAELVGACKSCLAEIDDFEMVGSYPTISDREGYADWRSGIEAAIARAEAVVTLAE